MITKQYKNQCVLNKIEGIKTDEFVINELINSKNSKNSQFKLVWI